MALSRITFPIARVLGRATTWQHQRCMRSDRRAKVNIEFNVDDKYQNKYEISDDRALLFCMFNRMFKL